MAHLSETDKASFRELSTRGWEQSEEERSPRYIEPSPAALRRYCEWATQATKFFKGTKPVDFGGDHWKL
ncbi:hypothetical protein ACWPKS_17850 [Coraliomargarita sp. W4R72]